MLTDSAKKGLNATFWAHLLQKDVLWQLMGQNLVGKAAWMDLAGI